LREQIQRAEGVPNASPLTLGLRNAYLDWVDVCEGQLASLTHDPDVVSMLQTERYRQIWQIGLDGTPEEVVARHARAYALIRAETSFQAEALRILVVDLDERIERAGPDRGEITVLDTNVLLHFQRPDQVPWTRFLERPSVRLVLPLRVVEELDAKKYSDGRGALAERARTLLPWIESAIESGDPIRENTTLEILVDGRRHLKPQDADREVLDTCHELRQFSGQRVRLVTTDTAMLVRARHEGIEAVKMPAEYERQRPGSE
jgi:hypothetical protein